MRKNKMSSPPGRKNINWRTPPGRLARAILHEMKIIHPEFNEKNIGEKFFHLWPDCQKYFKYPVTPHKLWDRWDKGTRPDTPTMKYTNEHPDKNPETMKYLSYAQAIVKLDEPITRDQVENIIVQVKDKVPQPIIRSEPERLREIDHEIYYFYIASDFSDKCKPGVSQDAYKRIAQLRTSNRDLRIAFLFTGSQSECIKLENILKKDWNEVRDSEYYRVPAMTMRHVACATIMCEQISLWELRVKEH
jgi:hypothetical protein